MGTVPVVKNPEGDPISNGKSVSWLSKFAPTLDCCVGELWPWLLFANN